jgi:hypothetical protein
MAAIRADGVGRVARHACRTRKLESLKPRHIENEDNRAADLDFKVLGHVQQTWLQRR